MKKHNILLLEPSYKNKYPPLGLMKIAQYHGSQGKDDNVVFMKGEDPEAKKYSWDRIYVTTLFTFEFPAIRKNIDRIAKKMCQMCEAKKIRRYTYNP